MQKITFVVESKKWVQFSKVKVYKNYISNFNINIVTIQKFEILWRLGFYRRQYIIFSSWRLVIKMINEKRFKDSEFDYFMGCVTSHSNLNDVMLDDKKMKTQLNKALNILNKFKVITVNSKILYDFLISKVTKLEYCPNGVDIQKFKPNYKKVYDSNNINIGFVAKNRAVKRIDLLSILEEKFKDYSNLKFKKIIIDRQYKSKKLNENEMRDFYQSLDYYICLSDQEGTPNPALEAAACGCLLISTKVGNMPEIIIDNVNSFFIDQNIDNIILKIHQILKIDSIKYDYMSKQLLKEIRSNWSWVSNVNDFEKSLNSLIS